MKLYNSLVKGGIVHVSNVIAIAFNLFILCQLAFADVEMNILRWAAVVQMGTWRINAVFSTLPILSPPFVILNMVAYQMHHSWESFI